MAADIGGVRLPNVLLIGAQKAGTSALHAQLGAHPDVFASAPKEIHFFSHNHGQPRDLGTYRHVFAGAAAARIVLESSTTYAMFPAAPGTPARIHAALGDVKLIYLMREPFARMRAAYVQALSAGAETRPIGTALIQDTRYLYPSLYATQVEQYLAHFPRERLLCLRHEDLRDDPGATLDQVLVFLGLAPGWRPPELVRAYNVTAGKRAPRAWWRQLGGVIRRWHLTPMYSVLRHVPRDSRLVTRPIEPGETEIPEEVRSSLLVLVRRDLERLRELLGEGWDWGHLSAERDDRCACAPPSEADP
jgi:hypothetical protein